MALEVETGSGSATAESYISVADADSYHSLNGNPSSWSGATTGEKESALRQATQYLDDKYQSRWRGERALSSQALRWPRVNVYDDDGFAVSSTSIPAKLKQAVAVVALEVIGGTSLFVTETAAGSLSAKRVKVGGIEIAKEFAGSQSSQPSFPKAAALLAGLISANGARYRA